MFCFVLLIGFGTPPPCVPQFSAFKGARFQAGFPEWGEVVGHGVYWIGGVDFPVLFGGLLGVGVV